VQRTLKEARSSCQRRQRLFYHGRSHPLYRHSNTTDIHEQANSGGPHARDPGKLSHHVHRIGYHFLSSVVEDACQALGYHAYKDTFITTEELRQRQHNSIVSKAFAKQGLNYDRVTGNEETPEQVRAAIKEMFPKIPQHDLDEIVTRAWEAGSDRVGSATDVPLSRRVQLATLARIRHTYTDYDALLRAFGDWRGTRQQVEPICVQKMIEWRGEFGGDDEGLEEIIRETIVIDDDDDDEEGGGDDDSSDTGGASDTSLEISHRPAAVEDLRAEEATERDHRFFQRNQPYDRDLAKRSDIARQKINAVRTGQHNRRAYAQNQSGEYRQPQPETAQRIYIPPYGPTEPPQQVMSGGRIMRLVSQGLLTVVSEKSISHSQMQENTPQQRSHPSSPYTQPDRPMQSIERDEMPQVLPVYHSLPSTPQAVRTTQPQHRVVDLTHDSPGYAYPLREIPRQEYDTRQPFRPAYHDQEVVDLTSPQGQYSERPQAQPEVIRVIPVRDDWYAPSPVDQNGYRRAPEGLPQTWRIEDSNLRGHEPHAAEYDPNRPIIDLRARGPYNAAPSPRFGSPTQFGRQQYEQLPSNGAYGPGQHMVQYTYPPTHGAAHPVPMTQSRSVPVPVHGAPAPVQQMPRELGPAPKARHIPNSRYNPITLDGPTDPPGHPVYAAPQYSQPYPR